MAISWGCPFAQHISFGPFGSREDEVYVQFVAMVMNNHKGLIPMTCECAENQPHGSYFVDLHSDAVGLPKSGL
jgi:hypothetical protein